jgi:NitT/TauT family transport system permease protein
MAEETAVERPEYVANLDTGVDAVVRKPLAHWEKILNNAAVRKGGLLILLAGAWELYAALLGNPLLFPRFSDTVVALYQGTMNGVLPERTWVSIKVLLMGYAAGLILAALLTSLAITTRIGNDFLGTITAMFSPLPAIALLPMALLWFGLGNGSLVFVLVHSVLWPVALNTHSGFLAVSPTLRMVGRNYGLSGPRYIFSILVPAAFPSILSGMKIGWAFAWRTLIAAELVFGVSSGSGGLGWFIYEYRSLLQIDSVFAGLLLVIVIGLVVENVIFRSIEVRTVRRWGTQS